MYRTFPTRKPTIECILIGLLLFPTAYSQTVAISVNASGTGTAVDDDRQPPSTLTVTASGTGTLSPFGSATFVLSALVLGDTTGTVKGTVSFTVGASGSLNGTFSAEADNEIPPPVIPVTVSGGTGIFSNASGTLNLQIKLTITGTTGTGLDVTYSELFSLTGTGTLSGVSAPGSTPFAVPNAPLGPGPAGDPSLVNCTSCSQPVTISNGNMYHQFDDLALSSRGFPLLLRRTYNSQSAADGLSTLAEPERQFGCLLQRKRRSLHIQRARGGLHVASGPEHDSH
jgi:hypothetical protein